LCEAIEVAPALVEQVEGLSFTTLRRRPHAIQNPASAMAFSFVRRRVGRDLESPKSGIEAGGVHDQLVSRRSPSVGVHA
jgi:hypothetical protein